MPRAPGGTRFFPSAATHSPATQISPASGSSRPAISRSVVVLPHPLGPSSATVSPSARSRETLSTTVRWPKSFVTSTSRRKASGIARNLLCFSPDEQAEQSERREDHADLHQGQRRDLARRRVGDQRVNPDRQRGLARRSDQRRRAQFAEREYE